jgi:diguanylate cyclase (GGDEF)-like protein
MTLRGAVTSESDPARMGGPPSDRERADALLSEALALLGADGAVLEGAGLSDLRRAAAALERVSLRDRDTGAYHLGYFADHAGKEFYKARRYGRSFSIAVVTADGLEGLRRAAGSEAVRAAARALVAAVGRAGRDADVLARVSDGEYFALLPETDRLGALAFCRRAAEEIRREPALRALEQAGPVHLALGAATFPRDGEDFDALLRAGRARQDEARGSIVRLLGLDRGATGFWELADALLGGAALPEAGATVRLPPDPELFRAVQAEVAREIGRDPRARAAVYAADPEAGLAAPLARALPPVAGLARAGDAGARVVVLGARRAAREPSHPLLTAVRVEGDARLASHGFLLLLSERAAYGLVQAPSGALVHTSDAPLVDLLVARLATVYSLPPA